MTENEIAAVIADARISGPPATLQTQITDMAGDREIISPTGSPPGYFLSRRNRDQNSAESIFPFAVACRSCQNASTSERGASSSTGINSV